MFHTHCWIEISKISHIHLAKVHRGFFFFPAELSAKEGRRNVEAIVDGDVHAHEQQIHDAHAGESGAGDKLTYCWLLLPSWGRGSACTYTHMHAHALSICLQFAAAG